MMVGETRGDMMTDMMTTGTQFGGLLGNPEVSDFGQVAMIDADRYHFGVCTLQA